MSYISLKIKRDDRSKSSHLLLTIPLDESLSRVKMPRTKGLNCELLDENFDFIKCGNLKIYVAKLKDPKNRDATYLFIEKEKIPRF